MTILKGFVQAGFLLLGLMMFAPGCVVEPREGYYDRDHHRWYHEHEWRECRERDDRDEHCRR
jgi:hypothetical protein